MLESNVVEAILAKLADGDRDDRRHAFDLIVTLTKYGMLAQLVEVHVLNESQMNHVSRYWNLMSLPLCVGLQIRMATLNRFPLISLPTCIK